MSSSRPAPPVPASIAIFFGILAVSTASIFIRFAQESVPSLVIAAYRLGLASLILSVPALARNRVELQGLGKRRAWLALLSGFFLAIHFASWITSLEYTSVASSVVLVTTTPLWVALLSPLVLREPIQRPVVVGLVIALIGGTVVGISDTCPVTSAGIACPPLTEFAGGRAFLGDLLALLGAFMAAGYMLIGRSLRPGLSLLSYIFTVYGTAAVVLLGLVFAFRLPLFGYPPEAYLWMLALAVIPQLIGHSTFNWALRYLPAAFVSITLLGEPIGSTILAFFILSEVPNLPKLAGGALILLGIYIASRVSPVEQPAVD